MLVGLLSSQAPRVLLLQSNSSLPYQTLCCFRATCLQMNTLATSQRILVPHYAVRLGRAFSGFCPKAGAKSGGGVKLLDPWRLSVFQCVQNGRQLIHFSQGFKDISLKVQSSTKQLLARLSTKGKKLAYEVDSNVPKDIIVFSYGHDKFYRMLTIFGMVQFLFWANLAIFSYGSFKVVNTQEKKKLLFEENSIWAQILGLQEKHPYKIAFACCMLGYLVMFFTWVYPQRSVTKLTLLRGGQEVKVQTYTHLGRRRHFVVPLDNISCGQSRTEEGSNVTMKIKGHWFFYMMDKRDGSFPKPSLFDHVVGLERNLK